MKSARPSGVGTRLSALIIALSVLPFLASNAGELTTTWQAANGSWSEAENWSAGEPTAAHTAEIPPQSTTIVDQIGGECLVLHVGTGSKGFAAQVVVANGSLTVGDLLRIGTAASSTVGGVIQTHGTVTISTLLMERGGYTAGGGTASITECVLGGGSLTLLGTTFTVTTDVTVETGSTLTVGGGTFLAGSTAEHDVVVRGEIAFVNPNVAVTLQNLSFEGANSRLRATIGVNGFDPFTVAGTLARGGRFIVNEINAPEGRYDILTAGAITGDFANVELPAKGDWSWGVENTTLFVVKGDKTPVAESSWGNVKGRFAVRP
jgi:hypothetical protein